MSMILLLGQYLGVILMGDVLGYDTHMYSMGMMRLRYDACLDRVQGVELEYQLLDDVPRV